MANYAFGLRFNQKAIRDWAERYPIEYDRELETVITPPAKVRGYFLLEEFVSLCRWKTPRSQPRVAGNPGDYIEVVTQTALSTSNERLRIEVLMLLSGVRWPTASVVLHFCHTEPYPILDIRALWSLGIDANTVSYSFEFWNKYTLYCRALAQQADVTMRELDRALWQYSKENQ
jgi:hypothetical protein